MSEIKKPQQPKVPQVPQTPKQPQTPVRKEIYHEDGSTVPEFKTPVRPPEE